MKDLLFLNDLINLLKHDSHYGHFKNLSTALRKLGLKAVEQSDSIEKMWHAVAVHVMSQRGESEPFLAETFIYPEAVGALFKENGLPIPAALQSTQSTKDSAKDLTDPAQFEQYFDIVCRNCGTVTDPLATSYRTAIGRLIFKTYLETRLNIGINTTAKYVLEHLKDFDTNKVVTNIEEDYVTWKTEDEREKLTSLHTIEKFILKFNRELEILLGH